MRLLALIILSLFVQPSIYAQYIHGYLSDQQTKEKLESILVLNKKTNLSTYSNVDGFFRIEASIGDTLIFIHSRYTATKVKVTFNDDTLHVSLARPNITLDEIEVLSEIGKYKRAHEEMLKTYDKTFTDAKRKPKLNYGVGIASVGITLTGLFSEFARMTSGKKKKDKRFLNDFQKTEINKFIAIRYNPESVMVATSTTRDSAVAFINNTPMSYDFAATATYLELQMWIRHHYKLWASKKADTTTEN